MFDFKKRKNVISTAAGVEEFIEKIESIVIDHWEDKFLMDKIGVSDLFSGKEQVNTALTYDEACDCLNRIVKVFKTDSYVQEKFNENIDALASRVQRAQYCDLSNVLVLFDNAKKDVVADIDVPKNTDEAIERINAYLLTLNPIKNMFFRMIVMSALSNQVDMTATV